MRLLRKQKYITEKHLTHEFHIAGQEGANSRSGELSLAFNQLHYKWCSFAAVLK